MSEHEPITQEEALREIKLVNSWLIKAESLFEKIQSRLWSLGERLQQDTFAPEISDKALIPTPEDEFG